MLKSLRLLLVCAALLSLLPPAEATMPPAGESQQVAAILKRELSGWRLAEQADYHPALTAAYHGQAFIGADFNQDGKGDYAVLVVSPERREYRAYYLINRTDGYQPQLLHVRKWTDEAVSGFIRTPMFYKPPGDEGIAGRDYNGLSRAHELPASLSPASRRETVRKRIAFYRSLPAIELFVGASEDDNELSLMAYRSKTWFYQQGGLKAFEAWD